MTSNILTFSGLLLTILSFQFSTPQAAVTPPSQHGMTIIKNAVKGQYFTNFIIGDPPVSFSTLIDLGNLYSWVACDVYPYKSTTYRPITCSSTKCAAYGGRAAPCLGCNRHKPSPSCSNNTCGGFAYTPWSKGLYASGLLEDQIFLYTRPKDNFRVLQYRVSGFPFACAPRGALKGIEVNSKGVLTLANVDMSLHSIISKTFKVPHKFALCLPSTKTILYKGFQGGLYIGGGPYFMSKENKFDFSKTLVRTPLVVNPKSTAPISGPRDKSVEYFINVKSIVVDGTPLKFPSSLLSINKNNGIGGTKISTMHPYTVLHSTIYNALVDVFTSKAKAMNIPRVRPVAPFGACYDARRMSNSTSGPRVPNVDLVLDGKDAKWRFYGSNLMESFFDIKYKNVLCLGVLDGGSKTTTSVIIGGKQMEDNFVEIDLETSTIGVTSAPVALGLSCSQFQSTLPTF